MCFNKWAVDIQYDLALQHAPTVLYQFAVCCAVHYSLIGSLLFLFLSSLILLTCSMYIDPSSDFLGFLKSILNYLFLLVKNTSPSPCPIPMHIWCYSYIEAGVPANRHPAPEIWGKPNKKNLLYCNKSETDKTAINSECQITHCVKDVPITSRLSQKELITVHTTTKFPLLPINHRSLPLSQYEVLPRTMVLS